jgi:cell division protein ZipA
MQLNISLVINIVLLVGVVAAIIMISIMKRKQHTEPKEPEVGNINHLIDDDIISVRKVSCEQNTIEQEMPKAPNAPLLVMYLHAGEHAHFAGYELLQALLNVGMRFGDMNIFHRHQKENGTGPVLFSLASAQEPGTFEIHQMGGFTGKGLCIFMHLSGNRQIDEDRLSLMIDTARRLKEDLYAHLLDDNRQVLGENSLNCYKQMIAKHSEVDEMVS